MEFGPLGGRKRNDSTVNLSKSKDFGPPAIDAGYGFGSPTEKYHIKTLKRSITKKSHQKFWEIDDNFGGKCWHFFWKRLKMVAQKFRKKFAPPPFMKSWIY